jgi:hypothetical protein
MLLVLTHKTTNFPFLKGESVRTNTFFFLLRLLSYQVSAIVQPSSGSLKNTNKGTPLNMMGKAFLFYKKGKSYKK